MVSCSIKAIYTTSESDDLTAIIESRDSVFSARYVTAFECLQKLTICSMKCVSSHNPLNEQCKIENPKI